MIPHIQRPVGYYPNDEEYAKFLKKAHEKYLAEIRNIPTLELKRKILDYDGMSFVGKTICRIFSDADFLLRMKMSRQVLSEREAS